MTATPDGILLVDKPAGISSHDVVMVARRALGERRIGHGGTLDPFATGLLVMLVGRATRLLPYLPGEPKVYEATVSFGAETDTEDLHGAVTRTADPPSRERVLAALPTLTGAITQVPPAYSAKRVGGRRAYALARKGAAPVLDPVAIRVAGWEVLACNETAGQLASCDVRVTCSGGTYVRALARELGREAGSAAHLTRLRRLSSGPFRVEDAETYDTIRGGTLRLRPALDALPHLPRQALTSDEVARVVRGIGIPATIAGDHAALANTENGVLVALGERRGDCWQPRVVLRPAFGDDGPP
jgi:tRNA pseudouridine55 synthase